MRQAHFPEEVLALLQALEARHSDDLRRAHREFLAACALYANTEPVRWRPACATALARGGGYPVHARPAGRREPRRFEQ